MSAENKFKKTLNLPQTNFPIVYNKNRDQDVIKMWHEKQIYQRIFEGKLTAKGKEKSFILPWGPPYSNGPLHMGHALNGLLKDFVCKTKQKQGYAVHFKFGSDSHGMPIEIKVAEQLNFSKENIETDPVFFKGKCREYARKWIEVQKKAFAELGIFADYENGYSTMDFDYEANILRSFGKLVEKGFIFRRNKSVPWCMHCQTVLASAEIEYKDRKDPSVYVKFLLTSEAIKILCNKLNIALQEDIGMVFWTTTPWSIPLNKALAINPSAEYSLVEVDGHFLILGSSLVDKLASKLAKPFVLKSTFLGEAILGLKAKHAINVGEIVPIIADSETSLVDGTAVVSIAPGCGPEDYLLGLKNGLEIYSPVSPSGSFTSEVKIKELEGLTVVEALGKILTLLTKNGSLLFKESITHSYPHCWRCRNGLIFRATKQWFCDLSKNDLQNKTLQAIEQVEFIPEWGKARFKSFIGGRTEWCISRQRTWGVPIVALKCNNCEEAFISGQMIDQVALQFEKCGIEFWDNVTIKELEKLSIIKEDLKCINCGHQSWSKERDTLDVWFDSGVQHTAAMKNESEDLFPTSMMLEGSDQHRGWFQSSILTSMALHDKPCTKTILTHGFIVDENREKMSKSRGNVISPDEVVKKYNTDVLRVWVASSDYEKDISISWDKFAGFAETFRKIRNTCRFMLSNLFDVDLAALFEKNYLQNYDWKQLSALDRAYLGKFKQLIERIDAAYQKYHFAQVIHDINSFCTVELSAEYMDMTKNRLYAEATDSALRQNTQIMFVLMLDFLSHRLSPLLSFLAEEIYSELTKSDKSIFEVKQPDIADLEQILKTWDVSACFDKADTCFDLLLEARTAVLKNIESLREQGLVKQASETRISLNFDTDSQEYLQLSPLLRIIQSREGNDAFFSNWFGASQVVFEQKENSLCSLKWLYCSASKAVGSKCERCWNWFEELSSENLCNRCENVVTR